MSSTFEGNECVPVKFNVDILLFYANPGIVSENLSYRYQWEVNSYPSRVWGVSIKIPYVKV